MVLLHFFCTFPNVSLSIKQILLQQHLFPRYCRSRFIQGWVSNLLNIFQHLLILKRLTSNLIMSQESIKHFRKKTGLQCYQTIPQRVTIVNDNQIDFNENRNVFKDLNEVTLL